MIILWIFSPQSVHTPFSTILWLRCVVESSHRIVLTHTYSLSLMLFYLYAFVYFIICTHNMLCMRDVSRFCFFFFSLFFCCFKTIGRGSYQISHLNGKNIFTFASGSKIIFSILNYYHSFHAVCGRMAYANVRTVQMPLNCEFADVFVWAIKSYTNVRFIHISMMLSWWCCWLESHDTWHLRVFILMLLFNRQLPFSTIWLMDAHWASVCCVDNLTHELWQFHCNEKVIFFSHSLVCASSVWLHLIRHRNPIWKLRSGVERRAGFGEMTIQ